QHLGAYNWLALAPRQAAMRAHVLSHLPAFATFFAEALVPIDLLRADAPDPGDDAGGDPSHEYREDPERPPERPGFDLKGPPARVRHLRRRGPRAVRPAGRGGARSRRRCRRRSIARVPGGSGAAPGAARLRPQAPGGPP